jgi:transcriptional regulator with XRE-family HTH domain
MSDKDEGTAARDLAGRVRELRLREGWSQVELARRAGVNSITYALFERSGRIALERLLKVLAVLRRLSDIDYVAKLDDVPASLFGPSHKRPRQRGRTTSRQSRR